MIYGHDIFSNEVFPIEILACLSEFFVVSRRTVKSQRAIFLVLELIVCHHGASVCDGPGRFELQVVAQMTIVVWKFSRGETIIERSGDRDWVSDKGTELLDSGVCNYELGHCKHAAAFSGILNVPCFICVFFEKYSHFVPLGNERVVLLA